MMTDHTIKLLQEMRSENTQRFDAIETKLDVHGVHLDAIETKLVQHDQHFARLIELLGESKTISVCSPTSITV